MGLAGLFKQKKKGPSELEKKILLCKGFINLWREFFEKHFSDSLEGVTLTEEKEAAFFKTVTILATRHFEFVTKMGEDFHQADRLLDFLIEVVSLSNLQSMSEAEFSSVQVRWHELFIEMNKTLGRLLQQLPPPPPESKGAKAEKAQPSQAPSAGS